ncbi:HesA/MoeB/ThiF family protein [Fructilactobacillus cliffordii]|uniref:ThiF family adenylyltransferase n=1 Tax=Fructilactobacillus cliffordii TaxID=2940299 RepID=A0A9Q8ZP17_9LACO|nr:ThiF family adenylyltransferase [Fructilactobacillus cliffordii]USS88959.1 ThiF family adenylyltransferase [Fructilactobacillus cliffordii]
MDVLKIKPVIKKAYPVIYDDENSRIIIGGFGVNTVLNDPMGAVKFTFSLLTGENSIGDICKIVCNEYPKLTKDDVLGLINDLNSERFIEDTAHIGSDVLSEYSKKRFHRNINFFSSFISLEDNKYISEKRIQDCKVGIIGLGGLGSHIVYDLAGMGFMHIKAIEFDKVELSNLNRQILYNEEDIGKSKAKCAKERLSKFSPKLNFEVFEEKVSSAADVESAFSDVDLIILVADRPKYLLGSWVNEAAVNLNVPLFAAGIEAQRALYHTVIPHKTGCEFCWLQNVKKNEPISDLVLKKRTELNLLGDNTAISPLVSAATGLIVTEIVRYVTGIGELQAAGQELSIDFLTMRVKVVEKWEMAETCPVCGGEANAVN